MSSTAHATILFLGATLLVPTLAMAHGDDDSHSHAETSTTAKMPEDGGPLPRATMPQGGVSDRVGKTDSDLPRAPMPEGGANLHCHLHEHHGVEHSHCHDHLESESHDHNHPGKEHCHEHEHDGKPHEHCHGHADGRDHAHQHVTAEDNCHDHQHEGGVESHCHDDADPKHDHHTAVKPKDDCHEHDGESHCHDASGHPHETKAKDPRRSAADGEFADPAADAMLGGSGVNLRWNGYMRTIAEFIENDPRSTFIGRNDGFKLANVRLGMRAQKGGFFAYVSFDAAVGERESFNDVDQRFGMRLRDAYMRFELSRFADVSAGRFKAPYDVANLVATGTRVFIDAALPSRGILPGTGNEVEGLNQGRQLGVMVSKHRVGLDPEGFDIGYALALSNGRTRGLALNDNDRPALFGRVSAHYADHFTLNVGGFTDARTVGTLPDRFDEDVAGTEVSAQASFFRMQLQAQLLFTTTSFDSDRPTVNSIGAHAQWAYTIWNVTFAYRFAWYDPNTKDIEDADQRTEHTIGLSYAVDSLPLRFMLNGTVAGEQQGRQVDNNRLALLAQFLF